MELQSYAHYNSWTSPGAAKNQVVVKQKKHKKFESCEMNPQKPSKC